MQAKRITPNRASWVVLALVLSLGLTTAPANAVGCNGSGCWGGLPNLIRIDTAGRIWFTVVGSAALDNLVPADGCIVKTLWTGQVEPALYIRPEDPRADELYTMLLTAFTTGSKVGFAPIKDPLTGWCSVQYLYIK